MPHEQAMHDTDNALLARLLRRADAPLGVIDTRPARRAVERWRAWHDKRFALGIRLLARRGGDDDEEAAALAPTMPVWPLTAAEATAVASTASAATRVPAPAASTASAESPATRPVAPRADANVAGDPPSYRLRRMPPDALARDHLPRSGPARDALSRDLPARADAPPSAHRAAPSAASLEVPAAAAVPLVRAPNREVRGARDIAHMPAAAAAAQVPTPASPSERPPASGRASVPDPRAMPAPRESRVPLAQAHAATMPRTPTVREHPRAQHGASAAQPDAVAPLAPSTVVAATSITHRRRPNAEAPADAAPPPPGVAAPAVPSATSPPVADPAAARRDLPTHQLVERVARVVLKRLTFDLERRRGKPWR